MNRNSLLYILSLAMLTACNNEPGKGESAPNGTVYAKGSYGYDLSFLQTYTPGIIELTNHDSTAKILVSPEWQGRVMTSTAAGDSGTSFGWINYDLLSSGQKRKQFNPVGGEERFWIGPEGGQYSFYFKKGDSFKIESWQVPAIIDTIPYKLVSSKSAQVIFSAKAKVENYSGTSFDVSIERTVNLLNKQELSNRLQAAIGDNIHAVAYETVNTITNSGNNDWVKQSGLISIWLLGMFTPTPQTVVIIPFKPGPDARAQISDNYFGNIPPDRLVVKDSVLFFTCDGKYRSKIGLAPQIVKPLAASYDFAKNVLTLVIPEVSPGSPYVNSKWEMQKEPYKGDVINSYNDGPLADGSQLGPFYEIESSSPALELRKATSGSYKQVTCHLQADYAVMKQFVQQLLAVDLDNVKLMSR